MSIIASLLITIFMTVGIPTIADSLSIVRRVHLKEVRMFRECCEANDSSNRLFTALESHDAHSSNNEGL
jgi:hypothetical protein